MSAKRRENSAPSFEESLKRLEEIVNALEQGDVPLEESFRLYEEGIQLSKACMAKLQNAELTLKRLAKDINGQFTLENEDEE